MMPARYHRPDSWETSTLNRLSNLREEIEQLFESPFGKGTAELEFFGWTPALDVYENKDGFIVRVELPGMKKDDIQLSLHENCLTVSGERRYDEKNGAEPSRAERFFGRFQRTFTLPKAVQSDKVQAQYRDGILTVTLPKTEESKPKQIEVKVS